MKFEIFFKWKIHNIVFLPKLRIFKILPKYLNYLVLESKEWRARSFKYMNTFLGNIWWFHVIMPPSKLFMQLAVSKYGVSIISTCIFFFEFKMIAQKTKFLYPLTRWRQSNFYIYNSIHHYFVLQQTKPYN